jgi:hypothetical protein
MKHADAKVIKCMSEPQHSQGATKTFPQHFSVVLSVIITADYLE